MIKYSRRYFLKLSSITIFIYTSFSHISKIFASIYKSLQQKRIEGVYSYEKNMKIRKSQENPQLKILYEEFLKYPNSHIAHSLLHTHYTDRSKRLKQLKELKIL